MTDWFEDKKNQAENNTEQEQNPNPDVIPAEKTTDYQASASGWKSPVDPSKNHGDLNEQKSDSEPSVSSWNSPSANGTSVGTPENQNTSTYHYGVNAQNPVPKSGEDNHAAGNPPTETPGSNSYASTPGGYRPQGNYNPYGWQQYQNLQNRPGQPPAGKPPKKKKNGMVIAIASLSVLCVAVIIALSLLLAMAWSGKGISIGSSKTKSGSSTTNASNSVNSNVPSLEISSDVDETQGLSTRSIVEKNINSTVVITVYSSQDSYSFNNNQNSSNSTAGAGSGIVMTADGYIITNWHVVVNENTGKSYDKVEVKTHDGTVYDNAEVIGADQYTDLAVIKVGAANLTPAEFGDSTALKLGDKVVAIGNAGGLDWTTTQGIVSGLARDVYEDTGYAIKCLQVDAAINPGNSGGPLLNSQGQVVGINSAKIVATGYEGLGFSIPINEAKEIIDDLVKYGYVKGRVMLGITGRTITQVGYEGFRIEEINTNSCLSGTNAKAGDIITHINGTRVKDYATMRSELSKHKVGETIELTLMRVDTRSGSKDSFTVKCELGESTN